nr:hypothetical protein [Streptomyces sp. WAC 01325]
MSPASARRCARSWPSSTCACPSSNRGSVDTDLRSHNSEIVQQILDAGLGDIGRLQSEDIADAVAYIVTRPRHVAIAELLVRPTEQA